jgi:hypothetical protein
MNESIIIGNQIQLYFSNHASLAAIGRKVTQLKLFEPIARQVQIAQKQVCYRPVEKLLDAFMALLPGAQGMVEINKRLKSDVGLHHRLVGTHPPAHIRGPGSCWSGRTARWAA